MSEHTTRIEETDDGFILYVDEAPVVKAKPVSGVMQCLWQVYGPWDLARSVALMKGFIHLTALLEGNVVQVTDRPPADKEPTIKRRAEPSTTLPTKERRWRVSRTIPRSRT